MILAQARQLELEDLEGLGPVPPLLGRLLLVQA
jgi:hypothetical protein